MTETPDYQQEESVGQDIVTAAVMVIGDEILSGRTKDKNFGYIADHCLADGIQLKEVRIVADEQDEIIGAVNTLRQKYRVAQQVFLLDLFQNHVFHCLPK